MYVYAVDHILKQITIYNPGGSNLGFFPGSLLCTNHQLRYKIRNLYYLGYLTPRSETVTVTSRFVNRVRSTALSVKTYTPSSVSPMTFVLGEP